MGHESVIARAGRAGLREVKYIGGWTAIRGWGVLIGDTIRGLNRYGHIQRDEATPQELAELESAFNDVAGRMTKAEWRGQARRWQLRSRWHYIGAFLLLGVAFALVLYDEEVHWPLLNTMVLAIYNFVLGLRSAYRWWQMETNTFFKEGAFGDWLRAGAWIV